jgi:hypothetical protein
MPNNRVLGWFSTVILTAVALWAGAASARADTYNANASPNTWGPPVAIKAHLGGATYTISYSALGNTTVLGEVTYTGPDGRDVTRTFHGSITFRTGLVVAQPSVRFKGVPFGSAVRVTVTP